MTLIMGLFENQFEANAALEELGQMGLTQQDNHIDVVSGKTVDEAYTRVEQHPEIDVPGSVTSLGAPTPPAGYDPTFAPGRFGEAYLNGGVADATIHTITQTVERGGALVAVQTSPDRTREITEVLRRANANVLE